MYKGCPTEKHFMVTEFSDKKKQMIESQKPRIDETLDLVNAVINGKKVFFYPRLLVKKISKNEQNKDSPRPWEVAKRLMLISSVK